LDDDSTRHYCPVQLKEVVPEHLNICANFEAVVAGLKHYADSADLTVAIKLNRPDRFDPAELRLPPDLRIGGLWVFGSLSAGQSEFGLWGDFCSETGALGTNFSYPASA